MSFFYVCNAKIILGKKTGSFYIINIAQDLPPCTCALCHQGAIP